MGAAKRMGIAGDTDMLQQINDYGPMSNENIAHLYNSVSHILSEEHREYLEKVLAGQADVDPLLDLEMFIRLVTIYAMHAVQWSVEKQSFTKDIGTILGEVRQGAQAIESMRNKRKEMSNDVDDERKLFDPTRKPTLAFIEGLSK